jgi:hypothetical protein
MHITKKEHTVEFVLILISGIVGLILFCIIFPNQLGIIISGTLLFYGLFSSIIAVYSKKEEYPMSKNIIIGLWCLCIIIFIFYFYSIVNWAQFHQEIEIMLYVAHIVMIVTFYDTVRYYSKLK